MSKSMNQVPSDFRAAVPKLPENATDAELEAWLEALPPCPGIGFADDEDDDPTDAEIEADIAAGRVYDHAVVAEWLKTWGTSDRRSFKDWLAAQDA